MYLFMYLFIIYLLNYCLNLQFLDQNFQIQCMCFVSNIATLWTSSPSFGRPENRPAPGRLDRRHAVLAPNWSDPPTNATPPRTVQSDAPTRNASEA